MAKGKTGAASSIRKSVGEEVEARSAPRVDRAAMQSIAASLPPLSDAQRTAFLAKHSDRACQTLGARTRAGVVEYEAARFLKVAHGYLQRPRPRGLRYTPLRLAHFAECLLKLIDARAEDVAARDAKLAKKRGSASTEERAREVSGELTGALREAVSGDAARTKELSDALDLASPPSDPVALLDKLTEVLERWIEKDDPVLAANLAGAGIDAKDLADARTAADDHRREREGAQGSGNASVDGPAVNVIEGRVIYEMRQVRKSFHKARERLQSSEIPRLDPSPRLQRVMNALLDESDGEAPAPTP